MKSLFALLVLGLGLGAVYWKTQHPEATLEDIKQSAGSGVERLKMGFETVKDGGNTNAVAAVNDTVVANAAAAANAADAAKAGVVANAEAVANIDATTQAVEARVLSVEQQLLKQTTSADAEFEKLREGLQKIETVADSSPVDIAALNSRVDLLNRRIEEQNAKLDNSSIEEKLEQLNAQFDQIQESQQLAQSEQTTKIDQMAEKVSAIEARLNTLSTDASQGQAESAATINAQIDQRLAQMEQKLATTNTDSARVAQLTSAIDSSRKKIALLESRGGENKEEITALKQTISELKTQAESNSIDELQSRISARLESLQKQIESDAGNEPSDALTAELEATRNRLNQLEQRVVELPASSNEADLALQAQNALQAQIASLESRLSSVKTETDSEIVNSLTQVQEQVSQLAAKSYVTKEELQAQQQSENIEYKIYFERNSTAITDAASKVLNSFITQEKNRTTAVSIYGFTDRRGSAEYNQRLALQRATNVRSYLIQNGFDYKKIKSLSGLGEDAAAAVTDDGEENALQRAVVLNAAQP